MISWDDVDRYDRNYDFFGSVVADPMLLNDEDEDEEPSR